MIEVYALLQQVEAEQNLPVEVHVHVCVTIDVGIQLTNSAQYSVVLVN